MTPLAGGPTERSLRRRLRKATREDSGVELGQGRCPWFRVQVLAYERLSSPREWDGVTVECPGPAVGCRLKGERLEIEIRYFDDCPNWRSADAVLAALIGQLGIEARVTYTKVESPEEAERLGFQGSPTVLIDGEDPWASADAPVGLSCRVYRTESGFSGTPSEAQLGAALEAAR